VVMGAFLCRQRKYKDSGRNTMSILLAIVEFQVRFKWERGPEDPFDAAKVLPVVSDVRVFGQASKANVNTTTVHFAGLSSAA
jgi:hypothetical protein